MYCGIFYICWLQKIWNVQKSIKNKIVIIYNFIVEGYLLLMDKIGSFCVFYIYIDVYFIKLELFYDL